MPLGSVFPKCHCESRQASVLPVLSERQCCRAGEPLAQQQLPARVRASKSVLCIAPQCPPRLPLRLCRVSLDFAIIESTNCRLNGCRRFANVHHQQALFSHHEPAASVMLPSHSAGRRIFASLGFSPALFVAFSDLSFLKFRSFQIHRGICERVMIRRLCLND